MNKKELVKLTPKEIKEVILRFIDVNSGFASKGEAHLAVCFEGEAGI